ncbi:hypothetical protein DPMN_121911 [Dreissena polymorpha]|uniref:Uncharacterized protein n=1 Tax=Dreissena polymorpha TaxID=45954 RepID=A0A9D4GNN4_DREPO|nr:hypothetical protein DPMN_121911 [Dreissena polymorpha]
MYCLKGSSEKKSEDKNENNKDEILEIPENDSGEEGEIKLTNNLGIMLRKKRNQFYECLDSQQ